MPDITTPEGRDTPTPTGAIGVELSAVRLFHSADDSPDASGDEADPAHTQLEPAEELYAVTLVAAGCANAIADVAAQSEAICIEGQPPQDCDPECLRWGAGELLKAVAPAYCFDRRLDI